MQKQINGYPLTSEQSTAVNRAIFKDNLKLIAFAGSGKTSTLQAISKYHNVKTLYIAFNSSIAQQARGTFPSNVDCRTSHSLAFENVFNDPKMKAKYTAANNGLRITHNEIMNALNDRTLPPFLTEYQFTVAISSTIQEFCASAKMKVDDSHLLPALYKAQPNISTESIVFAKEPLEIAVNDVWNKMCSPHSKIGITHDAYLKMFQLRRLQLDCELLLFDEAQDINPVVMDIIRRQRCQVILVGDPHQQIYGWRGSVDAMDAFDYKSVCLTKSFRFGPEIAATANRILSWKGERNKIEGLGPPATPFNTKKPYTVLCRGNMNVFSETLDALQLNKKVHVIGGLSEAIKLVESGYALLHGDLNNIKSPEIKEFYDWDDLKQYTLASGDLNLMRLQRFINKYADETLEITKRLSQIGQMPEEQADVVVSTAHKAKGRQWDQVRLVDGFILPGAKTPQGENIKVKAEDINLFYVATTRAVKSLSLTTQQKIAVRNYKGMLPDIIEDNGLKP